MILDVKAEWVIVGHSERRNVLQETDEVIHSPTNTAPINGERISIKTSHLLYKI